MITSQNKLTISTKQKKRPKNFATKNTNATQGLLGKFNKTWACLNIKLFAVN